MTSFDFLWQLLETHGVVPTHKGEAFDLWNTLSLDVQRAIYRCIRDKIQKGKFVHFNPVLAIKENMPRMKKIQTLSYAAYYERFGTTEEQGGWKMENPTGQKVIYVKE